MDVEAHERRALLDYTGAVMIEAAFSEVGARVYGLDRRRGFDVK